jgi:hypothetical protein
MASQNDYDLRVEILEMLLRKVASDRFPSYTMLDMIEELLTPEDVPVYAETLLEKMREDTYPSIPLIARLKKFA